MRPVLRLLLIAAACGPAIAPARAAAEAGPAAVERFSTDRPDLTEGALPVGRGTWQLEMGVSSVHDDGLSSYSLGEGLLRVGLSPQLEARVLLPSLEWNSTRGAGDALAGDAGLGIKLGTELAGGRRAVGLLAQVAAPTRGEFRRGSSSTWELIGAAESELAEGWDAGANFGLRWSGPAGGAEVATLATLTVGHDLTERLAIFVEYAGEWADQLPGGDYHLADGGASWLAFPGVQLDASAGVDRDGRALAGLGVSTRW